jgi:hypothetical protein
MTAAIATSQAVPIKKPAWAKTYGTPNMPTPTIVPTIAAAACRNAGTSNHSLIMRNTPHALGNLHHVRPHETVLNTVLHCSCFIHTYMPPRTQDKCPMSAGEHRGSVGFSGVGEELITSHNKKITGKRSFR